MTDPSPSPISCTDAHDVVDQLVDDGLPAPLRTSARESDGEVSLSLTLAGPEAFAGWAAHLDSAGGVPEGPWWLPPCLYRVAVGRLIDIPTVLWLVVAPEEEPAPPAAPSSDDAVTTEHPIRPADRDGLAAAARIARRLNRTAREATP